jgi:hypothetical protein
MIPLEHFSIAGDHAEYRPTGEVSLDQGVKMVTSAIELTRAQHLRQLLIVLSELSGFESPGLGTRYFFMEDWARASDGRVKAAMVARPEMIHPRKFGVTVAALHGFSCDVFLTEAEALAWLRAGD